MSRRGGLFTRHCKSDEDFCQVTLLLNNILLDYIFNYILLDYMLLNNVLLDYVLNHV